MQLSINILKNHILPTDHLSFLCNDCVFYSHKGHIRIKLHPLKHFPHFNFLFQAQWHTQEPLTNYSLHPFHAGSTSSGTPASHMAGLPLELPPFTGSTKCALVLLGNGNRNAFRICCADGVQPLAGAAPQKQPCPSEEQPAKSGHTAEL